MIFKILIMSVSTSQQRDERSQNPTEKSHLRDEASITRVLKYTGLFGGVQVIYAFIAIVRNKITAVLLGLIGMGLIENYNRTAEFLGASTNLGIAFSAVQHLARLHSAGRTRAIQYYATLVRSWAMLSACLGFVVTLFIAPLASALLWDDWRNVLSIAAVAPIVACSALSGGEMAILKGLGRVKSIALLSLLTALATLLITTAAYLLWDVSGILPALCLSALGQLLLTLRLSHRVVPYRIQLRSWNFLKRGWKIVQLGLAYAIAGFIMMGGEWIVRIIIMRFSSFTEPMQRLEAVGIYAAGFALTVSYSRLLFTAMDADYFPRLSAATIDRTHQNIAVNRQIDVLVQLATPSILLFAALLPWLVRLLYSSAFATAATMAHYALPYLFFKAIAVPIGYLALAHARSRLYLLVESSYTLFFVTSMAICYTLWSYAGAGAALSIADALYLVVTWAIYAHKFGFSMSRDTLQRTLVQSGFLFAGWFSLGLEIPFLRYGFGTLFFAISWAYSLRFLLHSTGFFARFSARFRKNS